MKARAASKNGGRTPPDVSCCKVTGQSNVLYNSGRSHSYPNRSHSRPPHGKMIFLPGNRRLFADNLIVWTDSRTVKRIAVRIERYTIGYMDIHPNKRLNIWLIG
ncbi:MAG: hypothetical protein LBM08_02280 [Dysgonamonadaceae bacterium]|nr:hypothetical protein [Dysgonamonadaceae bacterium]